MAVHTKFQMRRRAHRLLLLINVHHSKFYFAPVPRRMSYAATIQRFLKVMAMVWAGSQVTKLARAAGALALAPLVDKGLAWFTVKFKFESQGRAFTTIIGTCLVPGLVLFSTVTPLWALESSVEWLVDVVVNIH